MAAAPRLTMSNSKTTSLLKRRDGLPNLEELWSLNETTSLRESFQSGFSFDSDNGFSDTSGSHSRKSSSEYCPATPSQCQSPSIEQFYFGMDNESPTLKIGMPDRKGIDDILMEGAIKPNLPIRGQPQMLASLTSFLDSQHDHYAAAINAAELVDFDNCEDGMYGPQYDDYDGDNSDEDFEYATIEIASIVALSRPVLRPKLVHISRPTVHRTLSAADSTSRQSSSSAASKLYSHYSWTEEISSDLSDHADAASEIDRPEGMESDDWNSPIEDSQSYTDNDVGSPPEVELFSKSNVVPSTWQSKTYAQGRKETFPRSDNHSRNLTPHDWSSAANPVVDIPSRTSSKHPTQTTKSKPSRNPRQAGRYSILSTESM